MLYSIGVKEWEEWEEWELAQEREDRIWLLLKAFAGAIVLAAFRYAARAFVAPLLGA